MKLNSFQIILDYQSLDKYKFEPWNNRRLGAAKRSIKKERGKAGLFGEELMRFTTVEERIVMIEKIKKDFIKRMRNSDAAQLQKIKDIFNSFDNEAQNEIVDHWNSYGENYPKKPSFFLGLMHNLTIDPLHIKRLTGKAHPYTRSVVVGYGKLKVIEISKEEHEQSFRVG